MFTNELRELCKEMLLKNPKQRPGINAVLGKPVMRQRITTILNPSEMKVRFEIILQLDWHFTDLTSTILQQAH